VIIKLIWNFFKRELEENDILKEEDEVVESEKVSDLTEVSNETDEQIEENINHW
jgi:hypothetical protein